MWEEARSLYPSYQIPELDQSHHPKGRWLIRCLLNLRAHCPEHPDKARPHGQHRTRWEPPGGHTAEGPCSEQRQPPPSLGIPGPACLPLYQAASWVAQDMPESTQQILCWLPFKRWYLPENHRPQSPQTFANVGFQNDRSQWESP